MKQYYKNYLSNHFCTDINRNAKDFEVYRKYFRKNYLKSLPKNKNARIADIGCGMGHFLYFLKKEGYTNLFAVDFSKEMVDYCVKQKIIDKKNITYGNIQDFLKKNKNSFDFVVMNDVIEHIPKKEMIATLFLIKSSLKEGGKTAIKTPNLSNFITGSSSRYIDFTHTIGFTEESLIQVMKMAGFSNTKVYAQDIWVINPAVNFIGKIIQGFFNLFMRALFALYGRTSAKIFTKDIIAVGEK